MPRSHVPNYVHWLATLRQAVRLATVPRQQFGGSPLRPISRDDLERIFSDTVIEKTWQDDVSALRAVYPDAGPKATDAGERRAIYYLVAALKPESVLEVGTARGASTLTIGQALATHSGPRASIVTLDVADANAPKGKLVPPKVAAAMLGLEGTVTFGIEPALEFLGRSSTRFDLIFLDGDHASSAVYREIAAALRRLNPNGTILLHDFHPGNRHVFKKGYPIPGPYLAVRRIRKEGNRLSALPFGELPWPTRQGDGEHASCLALLTRG